MKDLRDPITGKINPITSTNPMKGEGMKRLIGMIAACLLYTSPSPRD